MLRRLLLLALALGGCSTKSVDPCAGEAGACVALQLEPSASVTQLDSATIHLVQDGSDHAQTTTRPKGAAFSLPVAVALLLPTPTTAEQLTITVDGALRGSVIAHGTGTTSISGRQHATVHITMAGGAPTPMPDMAVADDAGGPDLGRCSAGTHECGGSCVSDHSTDSCGASCDACPLGANASAATCDGTSCSLDCVSGTHLCNGQCVSSTSTDSCNLSCTPCTAPTGGTATCDGTACGGSCPAGKQLCAGACIDSGTACNNTCPSGTHDCNGLCYGSTDTNACGPSCLSCPLPSHGDHAVCTAAGTCDVVCVSGYKKCGSSCIPLSGCCGDGDCSAPTHGSATCDLTTHSCVVSCDQNYTDCSGSCAPITNVNSCGPSCATCTAPTNATATCDGTSCDFSCIGGYVKSGSSCVACGAENQTCCANSTCNSPFACMSGTCQQKYLTWTAQTSVAGVTAALNGVWISSSGAKYAVGDAQTIVYSTDGVTWSKQTGPTAANDLKGIWGRGNGAFAVGDAGEFITTSGTVWNRSGCALAGDTNGFNGITGDPGTKLYLFDSAAQIEVFDTAALTCNMLTGLGLNAISGVFASGSDIYAAGERPGFLSTPGVAHSKDGGATWTVDMQPATTGFNTMTAIGGTAAGHIYVSGGQGFIFRAKAGDSVWTADSAGDVGGNSILGFWGSDVGGYVYAVGENGTIVHTTGDGVWHKETSNTTVQLNAVWGNAAGTEVYAVGANGTVLRGK